jgi:uncharacterized protein (PEP-CTERM system associated)
MGVIARRPAALGAGIAVATAANVHAQVVLPSSSDVMTPRAQVAATSDAGNGRTFSVVPRLLINETLTDNARLETNSKMWDLVSQVTPGIRIDSTGGRVKGFLDYALTGIVYARNSNGNEFQNNLNSLVNVEAVEKWAFIDFNANISQQVISAYGTRTADSTLINSNRTEVRTLGVSPYVKGRLAGSADYEVRWTQYWSRNSTTESANYDSSLGTVRVTGDAGPRLVSWAADGSHFVYNYRTGRRSFDDIVHAIVNVVPNPQLRLSLVGGRESSNISSLETETNNTPGFGIEWDPTERTQLTAKVEKRFFGPYHSLSFAHRTPRTVWRYTDTQDVTTGFGQPVPGSQGTAYDLFFAQFASIQPDPAQRATLVNEFLQVHGIAPTTQVFTGSLASAPTRERRQELSFALLGIRDTVTFGASQTEGLRLDNTAAIADDFVNGNLVKQRGFSIGVSHRLTPTAALNLLGSIDRTSGNMTSQSTTLRSVSLYWTDLLGPRGTFSLGARHSSFSSATQPYEENAVTAAVGLRF